MISYWLRAQNVKDYEEILIKGMVSCLCPWSQNPDKQQLDLHAIQLWGCDT